MAEPIDRLLFIYNADSGLLNLFVDGAKKLLRISDCALCDLTHGATGERAAWASCRRELGVEVEALHRDELDDELRALIANALPTVVAVSPRGRQVLLTPEVIERCKGSIQDLRGKLLHHAARLDLAI